MKMCQAMTQDGYEVELFAPAYQRPFMNLQDLLRTYGIKRPFKITWLADSFRGWGYAYRATRAAQRAGVDIVYARSLQGAMLASRAGIPTWYEAHDLPRGRLAPIYFYWLRTSQNFRYLIVITEALERMFRQYLLGSFPEQQIIVAPDGVDLEQFVDLKPPAVAKRQLNIASDQYVAGYAGHLYAGRGVDVIIGCAERLSDVLFLVVGGEPSDIAYWQAYAG